VGVARQAYAIELALPHRLLRPGDTLEADVHARDANDAPVDAEGTLRLERRRWVEVWIDPRGTEVTDEALERARDADPTTPLEQRAGWRLVRSGYVAEEVARATVRTGASGDLRWKNAVARAGYY